MANYINAKAGSPSAVMARKLVKDGMIFTTKGKPNVPYAAMGQRSSPPSDDARWMSKNLITGEAASTEKGDTKVTIVGTYEIVASFAPGYDHLITAING